MHRSGIAGSCGDSLKLLEAAESEFFLEGLLWVCVMGTLGI